MEAKPAGCGQRINWLALLVLAGLFLGPLTLKAVQGGWFAPHPQLELNSQPALLFFTLSRGCECQMTVVHSAEQQISDWEMPSRLGLHVIPIDFNRRPDLAQQYGAARAPALILLGVNGEVVWKQDVGLSDAAPLDLAQAEAHIQAVFGTP